MKKYIVLSVNENPDYLFHVPLVCWAWRYFGWEPIVFYCCTGWDQDYFAVPAIESYVIRESKIVAQLVKHFKGYESSTIAQVSRLYADATGRTIGEQAYFMTGDIDMLPLSDYWNPDMDKLTVWGRDLTDYHYPMCYIGAHSWIWSDVMNINMIDYNDLIKRDLDSMPQAKSNDKAKRWVTDQDLITERINASKYTPVRIDRGTDKRTGYPIGRIDRSHWTLDHKQYIDAHLFHDVHRNEESFKKTLQMLHTVWPKEDFSWWVRYYVEFKKLCQNKSQFAQ